MRKAFRHTGVLMMLGVVALGLVGAAYTLWYENLTLTANVSTGTLDADWSCEEFQQTGGAPHDPNSPNGGGVDNDTDCLGAVKVVWSDGVPNNPPEWTEFAGDLLSKAPTCTIGLNQDNVDANPSNTVGDAHNLTLGLGGLYPYTGCQYSVDIHSDGSVPIHFAVTSATFTGTNGTDPNEALALLDALEIDNILPNPDAAQCDGLWDAIMAKLGGAPNPVVVMNGQNPLQLHFSDELVCNFTVWLQQADVEGLSGTLSVTIQAHQWNEAANPAATTTTGPE